MGRKLHLLHVDTLLVQASLEVHAQTASDGMGQEAVEAARRLRRAAVEEFVEHIAACWECHRRDGFGREEEELV
jgi:hypothetical protein